MKYATTKNSILTFNGNCKSSRIRKALTLTGDKKVPITHLVISSNGRFDPDSINIRRYAKAINRVKSDSKVRVAIKNSYWFKFFYGIYHNLIYI